jgi:hypothetical protein
MAFASIVLDVAAVYLNRWAIELYPPKAELVNDAHVYHLWLLSEEDSPLVCWFWPINSVVVWCGLKI